MLPCVPFSNGSTKLGQPDSLSIDSKDRGDPNIRMARERKVTRGKMEWVVIKGHQELHGSFKLGPAEPLTE